MNRRDDPTPTVCCEECGRELEIVCPKGHKNPMERRRKSKGPIPPAPRTEERQRREKPRRQCADCPAELPKGSTAKRCAACKELRYTAKHKRRSPSELTPEQIRQKEIGQTLRAARIKAGVTDIELAASIGRQPITLLCWETGNNPIRRDLIPVFASRFGLRQSDLTNELRIDGRRGRKPREKAAA